MDLKTRSHQEEQLDNLSLSGNVLRKTLTSLRWINRLFGNHRQLGKAVLHHVKERFPDQNITIVDLGCGGGDCLLEISKKLKKNNVRATYIGIDGNKESIAHAIKQNTDPEHIRYETGDILDDNFILPECDMVISSHFIYHFKDIVLVQFLNKLISTPVEALIFSELYRNRAAYILFRASHWILPISKMAKKDGLLAIQRAFTIPEIEDILRRTVIKEYQVIKKPWFRMLVQVQGSKGNGQN